MKAFKCTCGQPLFFDNLGCLGCGAEVAYDPTARTLTALAPADAGSGERVVAGDERTPAPRFRTCLHRTAPAACNWLIPAAEPHSLCLSCRLTRTVPNLERPGNTRRLLELESAKRRVLYELQSLELPLVPRADDDATGLAFDFLESIDPENPVLTGHASGVVTLNVAEADDDYREKHRESLREPYRTVIGHLRHEVGHYYWDRLVRRSRWIDPFRRVFGDERADYAEALERHYAAGPPPGWRNRFISSYAASHPWEDWAESWAHYLHIRSTLETVVQFGVDTTRTPLRITPYTADVLHEAAAPGAEAFLDWVNGWVVLTAVLNETARSMGQPDIYPFVLNGPSVTKLHFVHCVMHGDRAGSTPEPPDTLAVPGTRASREAGAT